MVLTGHTALTWAISSLQSRQLGTLLTVKSSICRELGYRSDLGNNFTQSKLEKGKNVKANKVNKERETCSSSSW